VRSAAPPLISRPGRGIAYRLLIGFAFVAVPAVLTFAIYPMGWVIGFGIVFLLLFGIAWFRAPTLAGRRLQPHESSRSPKNCGRDGAELRP
jgi:hypothetical protein